MNTVDRDVLVTLSRRQGWPAVSLYLPTHRAAADRQQDRVRLRNLVRTAEEGLVSGGMRAPEASALIAPVADIITDDTFWRDGADGLAIFISDDSLEVLRLSATVPEQVVVGDRFYLKPLMIARREDLGFYALTVDRAGCRLLQGDETTIQEVALEGVPTSLADELRFDEAQPGVQYSSVPAPQAAAGGGRPTGAIFHGHGGEKDTDKVNLERYLRKVESAVSRAVSMEPTRPLILFGVDYALALYRSLNSSPSLVAEQVPGATDELTSREIHVRSLSALQPVFSANVNEQLGDIAEREGSPVVVRDVAHIVAAAASGRVKSLFFDDAIGPFGSFHRETLEVGTIRASVPRLLREDGMTEGAPGGDSGWDLIDLAAAETILNGGDVHGFSGENTPVHGAVALLRY